MHVVWISFTSHRTIAYSLGWLTATWAFKLLIGLELVSFFNTHTLDYSLDSKQLFVSVILLLPLWFFDLIAIVLFFVALSKLTRTPTGYPHFFSLLSSKPMSHLILVKIHEEFCIFLADERGCTHTGHTTSHCFHHSRCQ